MIFFSNKETIGYNNFIELKSIQMKDYWNNLSTEEYNILSKNISDGRLNMSIESKNKRKENITIAFKNSEKRQKFVDSMHYTRNGVDNPASKTYLWFGEIIVKSEFLKICKKENLTEIQIKNLFDTRTDCKILHEEKNKIYGETICPICNAKTNKKPSSFKRWHFDNCKGK